MKRSVCLLLCILSVMLPLITSCADDNKKKTDTTTSPVSQNDPLDKIPKKDYEGYEFKSISTAHNWAVVDMTAEELTGDIINNELYYRKDAIENRLNIVLSEDKTGNAETQLRKAALTQEHLFDLYILPTSSALTLYKDGSIVDQTKIDTMDLNNPWWAKSFNDTVNIGSKRYISFGQASLVYYSSFYIYAFNKQMITNYDLENPYDLIDSGKWTWDKMNEMMLKVATDYNADGKYDVSQDVLGLTGHVNHSRNLMLSSGATITDLDADGLPVYNGISEKYADVFEKYMKYFIDNPIVAISGCSPSRFAGYTKKSSLMDYEDVFSNGKALFLSTTPYVVRTLREGDIEYGIALIPKYDEQQTNYISPVYSATDGLVIPSTTPDLDRAGIIVETLGALSTKLNKEFMENVLHYRAANNPTDIRMINLTFENGAVDIALANNFGTCASILNSLHTYYNHSLVTMMKAVENKMNLDIQEAIKDFD